MAKIQLFVAYITYLAVHRATPRDTRPGPKLQLENSCSGPKLHLQNYTEL
ncbi:hypothetical protein HanRHA438_Chr03g0137371 [Helianthus annuus]|nr:hypothetical protein HanIR_Chr03g0137021 [Helianthus annuus]KAJ0937009.1 hypothetical protein HanRHA438_Chr03g0137371 [Helianthus annuus]